VSDRGKAVSTPNDMTILVRPLGMNAVSQHGESILVYVVIVLSDKT